MSITNVRNTAGDELALNDLRHRLPMMRNEPAHATHLLEYRGEAIIKPASLSPLHPGFVASGGTLLMAAFVTDLLYWRALEVQWENFSIWLITAGLIIAALAGLALLLDYISRRIQTISWWRFSGLAAAAILSLLNAFVHSRDAFTAVVPQGLELSAIVTMLLIAVGRTGWNLAKPRLASPSSN